MKKLRFLAFLMMGIIACFGMTSCGDDDEDEPGAGSSLIGTWELSYYDSEDGNVTETLKFGSDKRFVNTYSCDNSEYNYTVTGDYEVAGDPSLGCIVVLKAYDVDGEYVEVTNHAQLIGDTLELTDDEGNKSRWHKK